VKTALDFGRHAVEAHSTPIRLTPAFPQSRLLGTKRTTTTQMAKMRAALEKRFCIIRRCFLVKGIQPRA
jgi:hypothetical protein